MLPFKESFSGISKSTWLLAAITLVNRSGMMVLPFMSLYLTSARGFSISQAGIVTAFYGMGSMTGSYFGGWLSDRIGYFRVMLGSLIIGGMFCVSLAFLRSFWSICVVMFITSLILDMLRPAMSAAVTSFADEGSRTRSFSLIRMAINLGAGVGPAIAGILAGYSFILIFVADGLTSVAAGVVLYFYFHRSIKTDKVNKVKRSLGQSPLLNPLYVIFLLLCLSYAVIFFQLFTTLPLYYEQVHHLTKKEIGYLIALNGIIVFVFEMMLVFKLENKVRPHIVISIGVLLAGLGLVMLNMFNSVTVLIVSMITLSFSEILAMPFMMTVAVAPANDTNRGLYTGIYSTAWSSAFIIAPLVGTAIVTHYGYDVLWDFMATLALVTLIGVLVVVKRFSK